MAPTATQSAERDPDHAAALANAKRARRFFEHGDRAADGGLFDHAIESYVKGLTLQPDNLKRHKALLELAQRRKASGHKSAGLLTHLSRARGQTPLIRLFNAEYLWAMDPMKASLALRVMQAAVEAELDEIAYWAGGMTLDLNTRSGKPDRDLFLEATTYFENIGAINRAVEALTRAMPLGQLSADLMRKLGALKNRLEADTSWIASEPEHRETEEDMMFLIAEGGTRSAIDAEQREIKRLRTAYEMNPSDVDIIAAYAQGLAGSGRAEHEDQASEILTEAYRRLNAYRLKMLLGDLRIARHERTRRALRHKMQETHDADQRRKVRRELSALAGEQLAFELNEFKERTERYPEDSGLRLDYAKRLEASGQYDKAIIAYRAACKDPELRSRALGHLGQILVNAERYEEAIPAIREGLNEHKNPDGPLAMAMRYELIRALGGEAERLSKADLAEEAHRTAVEILASNPSYKEIAAQTQKLAGLLKKLKNGSNGAAA